MSNNLVDMFQFDLRNVKEQSARGGSIVFHEYPSSRGTNPPHKFKAVAWHCSRHAAMAVAIRRESGRSRNKRFRVGRHGLIHIHVGHTRVVGVLQSRASLRALGRPRLNSIGARWDVAIQT
jgi:hypothetical protein